MRASLSERLSLRRSVCARVRLVCGRGDGVPGDGNVLSTMCVWVGVLSTAAARRREPHGSEPPAAALAGRAAGRGRRPRPRPRPRGPRPGPGPRRRAGAGAGGRLRRAEPRARAAGRRPHVRGSADELGSAAPRAPRGDSWGRLIGGLPLLSTRRAHEEPHRSRLFFSSFTQTVDRVRLGPSVRLEWRSDDAGLQTPCARHSSFGLVAPAGAVPVTRRGPVADLAHPFLKRPENPNQQLVRGQAGRVFERRIRHLGSRIAA
jgi:hypothetical protein